MHWISTGVRQRFAVGGIVLLAGIAASAPTLALEPAAAAAANASRVVSFRHDVMPILSKAGCNAGVCHGNKNGKGGFKLSLRGQDPTHDYVALARENLERRIDRIEPDRSLILLKATGRIPHEGGRRFSNRSDFYQVLEQWIGAGAPGDAPDLPRLLTLDVTPREHRAVEPELDVQLRVVARFEDGLERDVSSLAVYESSDPAVEVSRSGLVHAPGPRETTILVRFLDQQVPARLLFVPERADFVWKDPPAPANFIDDFIFAKLRSIRATPARPSDDSTFVRRVYVDLIGRLPSADEARAFIGDSHTSEEKRTRLVDALLERSEFADWWALKWSDLLRNEEKVLDRKGVQSFHRYIRDSIAAGKPLDEFVREIVASRGSTYLEPAANWYRAMREPLMRAESTAQVFLGLRLQCARCHNHPFDRWTQDDYYGWASVFARVRYKIIENRRRDSNDGHEFIGEQIVWMDRSGLVDDPRTGRGTPARFLGEGETLDPARDPLLELSRWVTSPENLQFARAQVNRVWFHLLGRGLVEPIDDFRLANPPSHPELLDELAKRFVARHYDLRWLIRTIATSATYGLSAEPADDHPFAAENFAHARVRRLAAEELLDSLSEVAGVPVAFDGYPLGTSAREIPGVQASRPRERRDTAADIFLDLFGKPPRLLTCECERTTESTMGQAFQLISGETVDQLLTQPRNRIGRLLESEKEPRQIVEELFWSALSRSPTTAEIEGALEHVARSPSPRAALEDLSWSLVNSKEFLLRR